MADNKTLSRAQQVQEIIKCGKEPAYFIKKYIKIQHPVKGTVDFKTYPFQDDCVDSFQSHRLNIVLKSRQLGLSTICAAYAVWLAIFHKDKNILVIATKLPTAMNFIKKVKFAIDNLPKWILLTKFEPTKQSITFSNGSQITAIPTSPDAGRSEALSLLIIDEAAFIRDFDTIWTGLAPTFSTGGDAIILSTPNGVGGQYYRLWTEAESGQNDFNPIRLPWYVHPEHDEEWFKKETRTLPRKKLSQEYLCVGSNTKIVTKDGYKFVNQLSVGDEVMTHMGRFKPITKIGSRLCRSDEKLYSVSSPGNRSDEFVITSNHPMLSYKFNASNKGFRLDAIKNFELQPTWLTPEQLKSKRRSIEKIVNVLHPIYAPEFNTKPAVLDMTLMYESIDVTNDSCRYLNQWGHTKRYVNVDYDLGFFVGLYLAEGCSCRGGVDLGFHKNELNTHVAWVKSFLEKFGCRVSIHAPDSGNGCRIWTFNKHIGGLVRYFIHDEMMENGRRAGSKVLNFDRVLECGVDFIKGLLIGHHAGDGNHTHDKKTCTYSTSSRLIYQLRTLNSMFGLYPRIGINEYSKKNVKHSDMWYLEFQAKDVTYEQLLSSGQQTKLGSRTLLYNGHFIGRHVLTDVSHLIEQDGGYTVYDISVADDRSFVAHSAVLHNCDFVSSGDTFLQPGDLEDLRAQILDPIEKAGHDRNIWVWQPPMPDRTYVISADVSRGDAHDYSAFHIIDTLDCEVAAEYMGKVPPEKLADMLNEWGKRYNNALIVPENNTFGYFVNTKLRDVHNYKRLYYDKNKGDPFNYIPLDQNELPGFPTNQKTRVQILAKLEELIRTKTLKIYSRRLHDQLQAFVWNGNKPQASKDSYDDLIMSLAIGCWLVEGGEGVSEQGRALAYAMLEATQVQRRSATNLGGVDDARPLVNPNMIGMNPNSIYSPKAPEQVTTQNPRISPFDYRWLLR